MSRIARFGAYAAAFESAFESDDWAPLEPFFAENAVYDAGLEIFLGGRADGREEILAFFKAFLDGFDRRFESRELALLEGPVEEGQAVRLRGAATYRAAGVPDFVLVLEETITFEGDRITRLEDRYDETMAKELEAYVEEHGDALGFALSR
ncbi:MAG: nuclear transport factor 2 family protein [bacterium]|nr:nuclear transport factor 2 family protein [bacterium]